MKTVEKHAHRITYTLENKDRADALIKILESMKRQGKPLLHNVHRVTEDTVQVTVEHRKEDVALQDVDVMRKMRLFQGLVGASTEFVLLEVGDKPKNPPLRVQAIKDLIGALAADGQHFSEKLFTDAFGPHCGLNADWNVMAWQLTEGKPLSDRGIYLLLDDDDDMVEVLRKYDSGDAITDGVEIFFQACAKSDLINTLKAWLVGADVTPSGRRFSINPSVEEEKPVVLTEKGLKHAQFVVDALKEAGDKLHEEGSPGGAGLDNVGDIMCAASMTIKAFINAAKK